MSTNKKCILPKCLLPVFYNSHQYALYIQLIFINVCKGWGFGQYKQTVTYVHVAKIH